MKFERHPHSFSIKLWAAMTALILVVLAGLGVGITVLFSDFYLQQKLDELGDEAKEISSQLSELPSWADRLSAIDSLRLSTGTQLVVIDKNSQFISMKGELNYPGLMARSGNVPDMNSFYTGGMGMWSHSIYPTDFLTQEDVDSVLKGNILTIEAIPKSGSDQAMLVAASPLRNSLEAVVVLGSSPAPVQASIAAFRRIIFYSSLAAVVMATLVSLIFARQVTRPLALMQKGASRMSQGDFQPIVGIESRDELGELAEALNFMGKSLKNHVEWLSEERSLLQGIVEGISDAVIMLNDQGEILYTNEPAKLFWQGEGRESKARKDQILEFLQKLAKNTLNDENNHLMLDTQVLQVALATTQTHEGDKGFVAVLRDVTASLRAEKERRDFIASVTHELRTPLHLIHGYLEAIHDEVIPKEKQSEHIELVLDEARRLAKLVMELQEINRLERWQNLEKGPVELGEFLEELRQRFQVSANEQGITLQISEGSGVIQADRDRLLQVFINLMHNALRHTPQGKRVSINVQKEEEKVQFTLEDEGEGIPEAALPYIFERFYRVDKARSRKEGGMGLGLAIVKQIVEAHGGEIRVESQIGEGTRFIISLPV